jgi:phosphatidylglycerol:prolipoprotein diacylglycerol transferase
VVFAPPAARARRADGAAHADDLVFYATLGIIIGGRLGYVLFYGPTIISDRSHIFKLWDGGMSFHGGVLGVTLAIILIVRRQQKLNWLRVHDYVACVAPFGLFFGRLANFVNGELWGKPANYLPWAIVFRNPCRLPDARHPSQLYEAGLEGILLFAILWFFFWRTRARYEPGKLVGIFLLGYGAASSSSSSSNISASRLVRSSTARCSRT